MDSLLIKLANEFSTANDRRCFGKIYKLFFVFRGMVIKKIFDKIFDNEVHISFLKFGRGVYRDKFLLEGKKQAKKWTVKGGSEYANLFVKRCLNEIKGDVNLTGVIVSTSDLKNEIGFELKKVSNFQGVRKHVVDCSTSVSEILDLMNKYPKAFFALSFNGDDFILKIKPKAPTSGKPGKEKEDGAVADFCSLKTGNKKIVDELFFGIGDFNEAKISHTIEISDIIYPDDISSLRPAEIRELAKRKGVVYRNAVVDGIEKKSRAEFVA